MRDVAKLWSAGYALGASFENTLVVNENRLLNPEGLRFADEFARHKALDAIGDLALAGAPLLGAYRSVRGGHKLNHAVLSALMADPSAWMLVDGPELRPESARRPRAARSAATPTWRPAWWRRPTARTYPEPKSPYSRPIVRLNGWSTIVFQIDRARSGRARGLFASMEWRKHHRSTSRSARAARPAAFVVALAGAGSAPAAASAQPVRQGGRVAPDEPADKLYNEGVFLLNRKQDYKDAAKKFEEVERQHPYSEWARKSLIMTAYAKYEAKEYDEAVSAARRYVTLHPGSPDAAYAQFLIGSAYYEQIADVTRDQGRTEKAIAALEEVIAQVSGLRIRASAKNKIEMARDQLAGKEMKIGRYYLRQKDFTGAINRFKVVVTQYQTTRHVEEALMRLTEAYMALGVVNEAQTAAAVLGHNFPDSRWYTDAYRLVKSGGFEPSENTGSWISRAFAKISPFRKES